MRTHPVRGRTRLSHVPSFRLLGNRIWCENVDMKSSIFFHFLKNIFPPSLVFDSSICHEMTYVLDRWRGTREKSWMLQQVNLKILWCKDLHTIVTLKKA